MRWPSSSSSTLLDLFLLLRWWLLLCTGTAAIRHHTNNPSASTRPPQRDIVIHSTRPRGEVKGWTDSGRSVTPPGEWAEQQIQIQPRQRKWAAATTWCVLQKKNNMATRFSDERFSQKYRNTSTWLIKLNVHEVLCNISNSLNCLQSWPVIDH